MTVWGASAAPGAQHHPLLSTGRVLQAHLSQCSSLSVARLACKHDRLLSAAAWRPVHSPSAGHTVALSRVLLCSQSCSVAAIWPRHNPAVQAAPRSRWTAPWSPPRRTRLPWTPSAGMTPLAARWPVVQSTSVPCPVSVPLGRQDKAHRTLHSCITAWGAGNCFHLVGLFESVTHQEMVLWPP